MGKHEEELYFSIVKGDLGTFLRQCFATLHPTKPFVDGPHIQAIIYQLKLAIDGETRKLVINLPPRQMKSFITSVVLPAYILGHDPEAKIICISYSDELTKQLTMQFRQIVESLWYRKLFPNTVCIKNTDNQYVTDQGGQRYATSVGGTLTGFGGDIIIIDDAIKPEDAQSDARRKTVNDWYRNTVLSRLDDKANGIIILVMQRLHADDLTALVDATGHYKKLVLPAIATKTELIPIRRTPDGEVITYKREQGTALHEERESLETLKMIKAQMGSYNFQAQYQQAPDSPEGSIFKLDWFFMQDSPPTMYKGQLIISVDTAFSASEGSDYTAIAAMWGCSDHFYLLSMERGQWEYEELRDKVVALYRKYRHYKPDCVIETSGLGITLCQWLRDKGVHCIKNNPSTSKVARAYSIVHIIESGFFTIVDEIGKNDWVDSVLDEFMAFPYGKNDDQVDAVVQGIQYLKRKYTPSVSNKKNY